MERLENLLEFVDEWNNKSSDLLNQDYASLNFSSFLSCLKEKPRNYVGISSLGKPHLSIALSKLGYTESIPNKTKMTFLFGHFFEALLIHILEAKGFDLIGKQAEVHWNNIKGHIDFIYNGYVFDVKTMSDDYFKSFVKAPDNRRGYITQITCYADQLGLDAAFLCFNKQTNELAVVPLDYRNITGVLNDAYDKAEMLTTIKTEDDLVAVPYPILIQEIYQKQLTGKHLLPYDFRGYYARAFYVIEEGINNYRKPTSYVVRQRTFEETKKWLKKYGIK